MQGSFKSYQREPRTQLSEELFTSGMCFTTAPLTEGLVKELINYDIKDNGQVLVPRASFKAVAKTDAENMLDYTDGKAIVAGKVCSDPTLGDCAQVIIGDVGGVLSDDAMVTPANLTVLTLNGKTDKAYKEGKATFNVKYPGRTSIHGIKTVPTKGVGTTALSPIGTFAFNSSFYAFGVDTHTTNAALYHTKADSDKYVVEKLEPKKLTPKEAVMWGYNMLDSNPYSFTCTNSAGVITLLGILPYDDNNKINMTPRVNETIKLKCYYAAPSGAHYKVVWDYKDVSASTWTELNTSEIDITSTPQPLEVSFSSPTPQVMVRVSCYKKDVATGTDGKETVSWIPVQVMTVGFNFNKEEYGTTANVENKIYDLSKCKGMTYWKNRLVVYGVDSDPTILFMSDINNPTYFPYPNSADLFDEPIVHAVPFLDNLLVFTATKLHMLTLDKDGIAWTKKLIQTNLNISEWDIHLIQIVKNMVFFKSGNYYYMVVPKLNSLTGELTIAPISKNITGLLDNFKKNVENTLEILYNYSDGITLLHYYNYLDFEDIHNVYVFKTTDGRIINYSLLYNSVARHWRVYINENSSIVHPLTHDATQKGTFISLYKTSPTQMALQYHKYTIDSQVDGDFGTPDIRFKNYQFLDTGYKDHSSDYKKRYREIQFKINNTSSKQLKFYTEFLIDGEQRKGFTKYTAVHNTDKLSDKYGELTLVREFIDPSILPSATILAPSADDTDCWLLNESLFPEAIMWKIRVPVSGKGYAPRIKFASFNEKSYELLNLSWIYRQLYSR